MPIYVYTCAACGRTEERMATVAERGAARCTCGTMMARDYAAEQGHMSKGDLPDWHTKLGGVHPSQVKQARLEFADLGVKFNGRGDALVPGNNRRKFLKRRGLDDLTSALTRRR